MSRPEGDAFRKFADVVPRQNQQPDRGNHVDRGPRGGRGGSSRSGRALAEPAPQSGNTSSRCSRSTLRPTACATAPQRGPRRMPRWGPAGALRRERFAMLVVFRDRPPTAPHGSAMTRSLRQLSAASTPWRPDRVGGAVLPPPRACGAAGRGRGTRGAERRLPRRSAPAGPRRGRTARVCGGEPSRQPASRSGRRARAADGCPGGGAGSRGGGTAPATRADCPFARPKMPRCVLHDQIRANDLRQCDNFRKALGLRAGTYDTWRKRYAPPFSLLRMARNIVRRSSRS